MPPWNSPAKTASHRALFVLIAAVLLSVAAIFFFGPGAATRFLRRTASRHMAVGQFAQAQARLAWAAWLDPQDYRTPLLQSSCFRHLREMGNWANALNVAVARGAPPEVVDLHQQLGEVQLGRMDDGLEQAIAHLTWLGASPDDLATAVVFGLLARQHAEAARDFLDTGVDPMPDQAQMDFLWGVYWRYQGSLSEAESRLEAALAARRGHEPARAELAALLEQQGHFSQALLHYQELAEQTGGRESVILGLARVLRHLGRFPDARRRLHPLALQPSPSPSVWMQIGEIEMDLGNYPDAETWLRRLRPEASMDSVLITLAARTFALQDKTVEAEQLFARVAALSDRGLLVYDLQQRLSENPGDNEAARQLQVLYSTPLPPTDLHLVATSSPSGSDGTQSRAAELYAQHCGACHGSTGDGRGRAARHLFPRPRDLRTGRSQLVSTRNGVPMPEDLEDVLRLGMPGTSMPVFDHLSQSDRSLLGRLVLEFNREGMREQLARSLRESGDAVDEEEIEAAVEHCTSPGELIRVPEISIPDEKAIAAGRKTYQQLGCVKCHGDDGQGGNEPAGFDQWGYPNRPRDLVREPFKGGRQAESIYLRLAAGMPGTDHPAIVGISSAEIVKLVFYVLSLTQEQDGTLTNFQRWAVSEPVAYRTAFARRQR